MESIRIRRFRAGCSGERLCSVWDRPVRWECGIRRKPRWKWRNNSGCNDYGWVRKLYGEKNDPCCYKWLRPWVGMSYKSFIEISNKVHKGAKGTGLGAWLNARGSSTKFYTSAFYTSGVASAWCIFILILHSLSPCHSPRCQRSFIIVVLRAIIGWSSAPLRSCLEDLASNNLSSVNSQSYTTIHKVILQKPASQLHHCNNISHSTTCLTISILTK